MAGARLAQLASASRSSSRTRPPAHDRKAVAALEASDGIELERAEETRRAQSPGRAQWVVRPELEAAAGDERGRIGLGGAIAEATSSAELGPSSAKCRSSGATARARAGPPDRRPAGRERRRARARRRPGACWGLGARKSRTPRLQPARRPGSHPPRRRRPRLAGRGNRSRRGLPRPSAGSARSSLRERNRRSDRGAQPPCISCPPLCGARRTKARRTQGSSPPSRDDRSAGSPPARPRS